MTNIETIIKEIVLPIVENKKALMVSKMPSKSDKDETYLVLAESSDIARLIGHGGVVANSIREVVSVAAKLNGQRVRIKFESFQKLEEE